jgi:hypothetical protein
MDAQSSQTDGPVDTLVGSTNATSVDVLARWTDDSKDLLAGWTNG